MGNVTANKSACSEIFRKAANNEIWELELTSSSRVEQPDMDAVERALGQTTSLQTLIVNVSTWGGPDVIPQFTEGLKANHSIQVLQFSAPMDLFSVRHFAMALSQMRSLVHVSLTSCGLDYESVLCLENALTTAPRFAPVYPLRHLSLANNVIGLWGAEEVANILRSPFLAIESLDLSGNDILDNGLVRLCAALDKNKTLEQLILCGNRIGDQGVRAIANVLKSECSLRWLSLSDNDITCLGCFHLAGALESNTSLQFLELERFVKLFLGNMLDDDAAMCLYRAVLINRSLLDLSIGGNVHVSTAKLAMFASELTGASIPQAYSNRGQDTYRAKRVTHDHDGGMLLPTSRRSSLHIGSEVSIPETVDGFPVGAAEMQNFDDGDLDDDDEDW